jgi:hypothetical protein
MRWSIIALVVAGAFALPALAPAAFAQPVPCDPSHRALVALRGVPQGSGLPERAARLAALGALRARFPREALVHEQYQDAAATNADRDAAIAEYQALAERRPGDPLYAYLAARALIGARTKDAIPELERLAPEVPRARLALARPYQSAAFKDLKKLHAHAEAYVEACPASVEAAPLLQAIEPSAFVRRETARLRTLLERRRDVESLARYGTLWALEFKVRPAAEHEALRAQVANDLERLRRIDGGTHQAYYLALQEGYELVGDRPGQRWVAEQQASRFPRSAHAALALRLREEHPYPKESDPPEVKKAGYRAYLEAYLSWARRWPGNVVLWYQAVRMMGEVDDANPADVVVAGEGLLKAAAQSPGQLYFLSTTGGSSISLMVAHLFASRGVATERLSDLVRDGMAENEKPRELRSWDLYPSAEDRNRPFVRWYSALTVADVWLKAKDRDRARAAIAGVAKLLDEAAPKGAAPDEPAQAMERPSYLGKASEYWRRMAELAQLEGRKADAMACYQNAVLARTGADGGGIDKVTPPARALWSELGGTDEGWAAWSERAVLFSGAKKPKPETASWEKPNTLVPEFELTDLAGRKWALADLKGKTTFAGVWTST